jgi:hypothetical protein
MTKFTGIAYEPHPVSPERKAELREQGLQIIDARFKPTDDEPEQVVEAEDEAPSKRGRKAKAE